MAKSRQIGGISYSAEGYKNFVSLSKEEQIKIVADSLSPKSEKRATEILARIPHGDIEGDSGQPTETDTAEAGGEGNGDSGKRQRAGSKKS